MTFQNQFCLKRKVHEVSDSLKTVQICEELQTTMEKQHFRVGVSEDLHIRQTSHLIFAYLEIIPSCRSRVTTVRYSDVFCNICELFYNMKQKVGKY